jgi:polyphenol oxidase
MAISSLAHPDVELPAPFTWSDGHLAIGLPGAEVRFTTRRGGVSEGPYATLNVGVRTADDPDAVRTNLARVAAVAGGRTLAWGHQVHGTEVRWHGCAPVPDDAGHTDADGHATKCTDVAPMVLTADCLPVAISGPGAVAMVHAGWKGLAGGVLEHGVAAVRSAGDGPLHAAIGPGAGGCCYEVGEEVHHVFGGSGRVGERNLDLKGVAAERLRAAGVTEVFDAGLCTLCAPEGLFFSHRRDGGVTGRQANVAWRT